MGRMNIDENQLKKIFSNILFSKIKAEDGNPCSAEQHLMDAVSSLSDFLPEYVDYLKNNSDSKDLFEFIEESLENRRILTNLK